MFDEIEEDEREIRRLQRGELFRRPKPKLPEQQGDMMERRGDQLPTLNQMRAVSEALKGVEQACDITRAKPEFVEFIRTCHPASILALLNQHAALVEQRDRLARALRNLVNDVGANFPESAEFLTRHAKAVLDPNGVVGTPLPVPQPNEPQAKGGSGDLRSN